MGRRSLAARLGVSQPQRRDNDRPEVPTAPVMPPVPGTFGLPAVRVGEPASPGRPAWYGRCAFAGGLGFCCRVCCPAWSA
jgi:hypothetical protein